MHQLWMFYEIFSNKFITMIKKNFFFQRALSDKIDSIFTDIFLLSYFMHMQWFFFLSHVIWKFHKWINKTMHSIKQNLKPIDAIFVIFVANCRLVFLNLNFDIWPLEGDIVRLNTIVITLQNEAFFYFTAKKKMRKFQ